LLGGDTVRIRVTTNSATETVWATMPGSSQRISLFRTNSGSGNRTWETEAWDISSGNILISVSSVRGSLNNLFAEDTRTINRSNDWNSNWGDRRIIRVTHWRGGSSTLDINRNWLPDRVDFSVITTTDITRLEVDHPNIRVIRAQRETSSGGEQEWYLELEIRTGAPNTLNLSVDAFVNNSRVDSLSLPTIRIN